MSPWWRKTIAVLEIVGGVVGSLSVVVGMVRHTGSGDIRTQFVALGLFALSLCAGIQLWRNARSGYAMSVIVQLVQFPKIVSGSSAFMMSFGLDAGMTLVESPGAGHGFVVWAWGVGAYHLLHADDNTRKGIGFSIVSCVALISLLKGLDAAKLTAASPAEPATGISQDQSPNARNPDDRGVVTISSPPDPWAWAAPRWAKVAVILLVLLMASCVGLQHIP